MGSLSWSPSFAIYRYLFPGCPPFASLARKLRLSLILPCCTYLWLCTYTSRANCLEDRERVKIKRESPHLLGITAPLIRGEGPPTLYPLSGLPKVLLLPQPLHCLGSEVWEDRKEKKKMRKIYTLSYFSVRVLFSLLEADLRASSGALCLCWY